MNGDGLSLLGPVLLASCQLSALSVTHGTSVTGGKGTGAASEVVRAPREPHSDSKKLITTHRRCLPWCGLNRCLDLLRRRLCELGLIGPAANGESSAEVIAIISSGRHAPSNKGKRCVNQILIFLFNLEQVIGIM